jgi:hypothetical protein
MLYLMDSGPIPLKGLGYCAWTLDNRSDRTQRLKVHLVIASSNGSVPVEQAITAANVSEVGLGRSFTIKAGAAYVFDIQKNPCAIACPARCSRASDSS